MRIHILQHTKDTSAGSALDWLRGRGLDSTLTRFDRNDPLPDPAVVDWLIVCGGGMGVYEVNKHPWLADEKRFIGRVLDRGASALGLCLGGQLIAEVCGATVKTHSHWEVGWHPLRFNDGKQLTVFQWHQDTFEIPRGAERIAANAICENQAYAFGDRVIGVQFHPEATAKWVKECANDTDFPSGPYVQSPSELMTEVEARLAPQREWFFGLLDRMAKAVQRRDP